jgi:hypothetical protein
MAEKNDLFMLRNKDAAFEVKLAAFNRLACLLEKHDKQMLTELAAFVQGTDDGWALVKGNALMNAIAKATQVNEKH